MYDDGLEVFLGSLLIVLLIVGSFMLGNVVGNIPNDKIYLAVVEDEPVVLQYDSCQIAVFENTVVTCLEDGEVVYTEEVSYFEEYGEN
jgi:hypothetical protein